MPNPFLAKKDYTLTYIVTWALITGIHVAVLFFFSHRTVVESFVDGTVFNVIFAGLGLSVWFAVRYKDHSKAGIFDTFLYHFGTAAVALACWIGASYFVVKVTLPEFQDYKDFLDASLPWRAISGVLIYSVVVLIYYLYIHGEDKKDRLKREAELNLQVREAEIDRLRAQINPHFLFNSLNSISSLTISKPETAREMVVKLSRFLRYSLEFRENELTNLEEEIEHVKEYLDIEKVRFGDRLIFDFDIEPACYGGSLPNLILQPLYENAIKHGVYESIEPIKIFTEIRKAPDGLNIVISNEFDPEAPARKGKGIGLQNVTNRLYLIYQKEGLLYTSKTKNMFTARLVIPTISRT